MRMHLCELCEGLVTDMATGLKGMLTHAQVELGGMVQYLFQPRIINQDTGHPVAKVWVVPERIRGATWTDVELPMEILASEVTDMATGFKGTATAFVVHLGGCIHVLVQPKGLNAKGEPIAPDQIDVRRLTGPNIHKLAKAERKASEKDCPSPVAVQRHVPGNPRRL